MTPLRRRALLGQLAISTFLLAACGGGSDAEATPSPPPAVTLAGGLDRPGAITLPQLQALPAVTQTVSFASGSGNQTRTYTGANLWAVLDQAGIQVDATRHNDVLNRYVVATGSDGYKAVFALGELHPNFGNRASVLAYAETASGASGPIGAEGPFRVTSPGDVKGGRYVSNLVRLTLRNSGSTAAGTGGGASTSFTVSGAVQRPGSYDLAALQALPSVTRSVGTASYTGVDLWAFLNTTVGLVTNPAVKNDSLSLYVVATGSDGYKAVVSIGETAPSFGNQPNLIAYQLDGAPIMTNGFARLVLPNDVRAGRFVSNLVALEVFAAAP